MGQLAVRDVRPVAVELDEGLAHGHVQSDPLVSGQVVVERLPDQRVREAIAADLARALLHEPRLARRVEVLEQLRPLLGDHPRERLQGELGADHGGGGQHIDGLLRQRIEPAADRLAHPVGHRQPPGGQRAEGALGQQQPHHLVHEQRVALGERVEPLHQPCRRRLRRVGRGQLEHLVAGEAAQQQRPARPREVRQGGRDLAVASGLARAVGAHGEDAGAVQAAREELEQPHGGDVGRVQVVEHDHGGPPRGRRPDERCRGVEGGEARGLGVERRRGVGRGGQPLAELRGDLRHVGRSGAEVRRHLVGRPLLHQPPDRLDPGPVGRRAAALPGAAPEDGVALPGRLLHDRLGQAGLPDAGLSRDQEQRAATVTRPRERGGQLAQFFTPTDERPPCTNSGTAAIAIRRRGLHSTRL